MDNQQTVQYLNTDLELIATTDLASLAQALATSHITTASICCLHVATWILLAITPGLKRLAPRGVTKPRNKVSMPCSVPSSSLTRRYTPCGRHVPQRPWTSVIAAGLHPALFLISYPCGPWPECRFWALIYQSPCIRWTNERLNYHGLFAIRRPARPAPALQRSLNRLKAQEPTIGTESAQANSYTISASPEIDDDRGPP